MKKAKQNFINLFIVIVGLTNVFWGAALPAWGATLFVCETCTPYNSITSALTEAVRGDIVYVSPGDYYENIALTSEVDVIGSGADVTRIIGANHSDAPPDVVQAVDVLNAEFSGFTIELAPDPAGIPPIATSRAFWVESSSLTISRNVIRHSGRRDYPSTGVFAVGSPAAVIKNNVFYPESRGGYGVNIDISAPVVKNNIIMNYETGISAIAGSDKPVTGYNNIFDCDVKYSGVAPGSGALSLSPLFVDPADGDFHLRHDSPCRDTGDPADSVPDHGGSRIDMGAFEYLLPAVVEGPMVEILSSDEVKIVWQTSVPADSAVSYEQDAGSPEEVSETGLTEIHDIILTGLTPSTTYRYVVKSTDTDGNQVESEPAYFVTLAEPDVDPPWLEVAMPGVISEPVWVDVEAFDNVGVEKIEYFVNDELVHTAFGDKFEWQFDPAGFANGGYLVRVCAHDKAGGSRCQELPVDVYVRPADTSPPISTLASLIPGVTVSGPSVEIEIVSMDQESGIEKLVFFVDDEQLHVVQVNGSPGEEVNASYAWNSFGASSGDPHVIRVQTFNNDGLSTEQIVTVNVANTWPPPQWFNYNFIKLTRGQVKRDEVYYEAKLYVKNISSEILYDVVVEDYHAGFQAIQSDYGHHPRVRFDSNLKSSVVTYPIGNLMPGEQKECTINMSTVLIGASPSLFDYKIGKQTDVTYSRLVESEYQETTFHYEVPAIKTIEGWWGVNDIPLTTQNVLAPVSNRDYLVVTHPRKLYALYNDDNVDALLSELAEFADDKNAVLGYLNSANPMLELLKATNHNYTKNSGSFRYFVGGWSNLLQSNWRSSGYMLLVGETEIIPSFNITLTIPGNQYEIPLCDQPYSDLNDDGYRDLSFGRIIGNDATRLITPIQTSRGVLNNFPGYEYDAGNGLLISGVGNYYTTFIGNIDFISNTMNNYIPPMANEKLHIIDIDYVNDDDLYDQAHAQFLSMVPGKDIVYFNGHGYPGGWGDVLDYNDMPVNLGGVNPFVFAPTCSSGNYEIDNDEGIAETFLANGAGVYIGATRMSNTGTNDFAGRMFFRHIWRPYMNVGKSFRDLGQTLWSLYILNPILRRWVLSYNLYGDPKYGPAPGSFDADLPLTGGDMDIKGGTEFSLDIPMYEVSTNDDGTHHVEIPGGNLLSDPGQFVVPYWSEEIIIPAGQQVQDVTASRSGFFAETGLLLPVAPDDFMESEDGEPFVPREYDWFPDVPFRWNVIPGENGGQTLVLIIYPFSYQGSTTNSHFYDYYDFSITMVSPSVEISGINLYRTEIRPGEELQGLVQLHNTGDESLDIHFSAMVESYAGEQYTDGLSMQTIQVPPGYSTVVVYWDSEEIAEGYYKLKAIIEDSDVNRLDTASAQFAIDSEAVCSGDSDFDGDLDGIDLAGFIAIGDMDKIAEFADRFGTFCP